MVRSEEGGPVVAPTSLPGVFRHRHELERGHAEIDEMRDVLNQAVKRALARERAGVELVDD